MILFRRSRQPQPLRVCDHSLRRRSKESRDMRYPSRTSVLQLCAETLPQGGGHNLRGCQISMQVRRSGCLKKRHQRAASRSPLQHKDNKRRIPQGAKKVLCSFPSKYHCDYFSLRGLGINSLVYNDERNRLLISHPVSKLYSHVKWPGPNKCRLETPRPTMVADHWHPLQPDGPYSFSRPKE